MAENLTHDTYRVIHMLVDLGLVDFDLGVPPSCPAVQTADIGWPTGNGKKVSNSQACCLAQLCQAAA